MSGFRKLFKGKNKAAPPSPPSEADGVGPQSPSPPNGHINNGDANGEIPSSSSSTPGILPSADAIEASGAAYTRAAASRRSSALAAETRADDVEHLRQALLSGDITNAAGDNDNNNNNNNNNNAALASSSKEGAGATRISSRTSALTSAAPGANLRITSSNHRAAAATAPGENDLDEEGLEHDGSSARKNKQKGSAGVVSAPSSRRGSMSDDKRKAAAPGIMNGPAGSSLAAADKRHEGHNTPTSPRVVAFDPASSRKESLAEDNKDEEDDVEDDGVRRIEFYHRDAPYFWLSNSSDHAVVLDGIRYPTAEHLFQCSKFPHRPDLASRIRKAPSPNAALRLARTHAQQVRKGWIGGGINVLVMNHVLLLKFTQHSVLRDELLRTGDADLIEAAPNEVFWGSGLALGQGSLTGNFRGRNEKGKALMRTREQLRAAAGLGWGSGAITV